MTLIEELLNNDSINRETDESGNIYGIRVLGRGENLFFQENDKGLICQIDALHSAIFINTIREWEGEKRMNDAEKKRVIELIKYYYSRYYSENVTLMKGN
jgi:hypothetical protein